jgi:dienelactone hydrolase
LRRKLTAALCAALLAAGLPVAEVRGQDDAFDAALNEQVVHVPLEVTDGPVTGRLLLTATLYHPAGNGPFPLIVLSHGSPARAADRERMGRHRVLPRIREFVRRDFAVIVPMRRGFGATGGRFAERFGPCDDPDYFAAGVAAAQDLLATVAYATALPLVRRDRVILVGQSAGGFASLAAASFHPAGVVAVVNLSGGRGGRAGAFNGEPCAPERMTAAIARFAQTIRVPVLWHYAENDRYFGPHHARAWFKAFTDAGAPGRLVMQPPFGRDGHRLFASPAGLPIWTAAFDRFLTDIGFGQ